jgi:FRG domain
MDATDKPSAPGAAVPEAFETVTLADWPAIVEAAEGLHDIDWLFRGHSNASWSLKTSIEREFQDRRQERELDILEHFMRRAEHWLPPHLVPPTDSVLPWLGLIQHRGGPTRLLDVTRSLYVAVYFALEDSGPHDRAVWAINGQWCRLRCARVMGKTKRLGESHDRLWGNPAKLVAYLVHGPTWPAEKGWESFRPFTGVFPVEPWKLDARQVAQQASFLFTANIDASFVDNIAALRPDSVDRWVYKLIIPGALREEALDQLWKMNVTAATLFPDLDGLARSLRTLTARPSPRSKELRSQERGIPSWRMRTQLSTKPDG